LISARALGPLWVALALGFTLASTGLRRAIDAIRARKAAAIGLALVVVLGGATNAWWSLIVQPRPPPRPDSFISNAGVAIGDLRSQYRELIGVFGWLDTNLPGVAYLAWTVMVLVLLTLVLLIGGRRDRMLVVGAVASLVVVTILVSAGIAAPVGSRAQGRWVLPVVTMIPVMLSSQWWRARARLGAAQPKNLTIGVAATAALVHAIALWASARRYAVGVQGPVQFLGHSQWSPPMGWLPWLGAGSLACVGVVGAAIVSVRSNAVGGTA
jgi:hypothetical protein